MKAVQAVVLVLGIATASAATGSPIQRVPLPAAERRNPFGRDEQARRAGAKLYARQCASCHGANREGRSPAPPLDRPDIVKAAPGTLFWVLRNGSLYRGMPSFGHLPEAQRWQIVTFLQATTRIDVQPLAERL